MKAKIIITTIEIAAMIALKMYSAKIMKMIRPAGSRVRNLPDGTPVVRLDDPEYTDEPSQGIEHAAYLPRSKNTLNEELREKARRILHWWKLSWYNKFHKPRRTDQWPPDVLRRFKEARKQGTLPPYEFNHTTDHKRK